MFRIRTPRIGIAGAAATVALAALSLTACSDQGSSSRDEGASTAVAADQMPLPDPSSAAASVPGANHAAASGQSAAAAGSVSAADAARQSSGKLARESSGKLVRKAPAHASSTPVTCEASNTKMVASLVSRPVNHMLLTVTNTGSKTCFLYAYPALRFSDAQAVPPVIEDSHPQAVTTLNPGESGYASVTLSAGDGSGTNGRTVKSLDVYFYGRSGNESVGAAAHVALPAKGVYIDDSLTTTYWEQSMQDALTW